MHLPLTVTAEIWIHHPISSPTLSMMFPLPSVTLCFSLINQTVAYVCNFVYAARILLCPALVYWAFGFYINPCCNSITGLIAFSCITMPQCTSSSPADGKFSCFEHFTFPVLIWPCFLLLDFTCVRSTPLAYINHRACAQSLSNTMVPRFTSAFVWFTNKSV